MDSYQLAVQNLARYSNRKQAHKDIQDILPPNLSRRDTIHSDFYQTYYQARDLLAQQLQLDPDLIEQHIPFEMVSVDLTDPSTLTHNEPYLLSITQGYQHHQGSQVNDPPELIEFTTIPELISFIIARHGTDYVLPGLPQIFHQLRRAKDFQTLQTHIQTLNEWGRTQWNVQHFPIKPAHDV